MMIAEPARELPCIEGYDVVVTGAGIAGVAAALAAARGGARVALIDKQCGLGGLATLGNVVHYLPLCDGRGRQIVGGLGEELLRLSMADMVGEEGPMGMQAIPACWRGDGDSGELRDSGRRYRSVFNVASFQLAMEAAVLEAGIEVFYDTRLCSCIVECDRLSHVVIENKSGRLAMSAKAFVDASGDADLCFLAGEPTVSNQHNVLCGWYFEWDEGEVRPVKFSLRFPRDLGPNGCEGPHLAGDRGRDVSRHVLLTRERIRKRLAEVRAKRPGHAIYPLQLASIPCFRATRRLEGAKVLREEDCHEWFDDCVGMTGDWRRSGPVYSLPLRIIQGVRRLNLFAAGRCVSAEGSAWDAIRAIPSCAVTGEAAGVAAMQTALSHSGDGGLLSAETIRERLSQVGAILDPELVQEVPEKK